MEVWGISSDSVYSHKVFKETSPSAAKVQYPLVSDRNLHISRAYRVLDENTGAPYRATIIISPKGEITSKLVYPGEVGRNAYEILRIMQAIITEQETGLGMPANWVPGMPGIKRSVRGIGRV